ncbi:MAG TPA: hypothetical protein ENI85_18070, partial [Deltaproteobacteria bacterium]|nr:hypothetical protein [Deltaproteobacteria bacterium]
MLGAWLAKLLPEADRARRRRWIAEGRVRVDGRLADRPGIPCLPGAAVEIADVEPEYVPCLPAGSWGRWLALVDDPPWSSGTLRLAGEESFRCGFEILERRDGLALLRLAAGRARTSHVGQGRGTVDLRERVGQGWNAVSIARALAGADMPVVGDLERGGLAVVGGVRLRPVGSVEEEVAKATDPGWPDEPAWVAAESKQGGAGEELVFRVSRETARMLARGHPWVLPDAASDSAARFRPGSLVRLVARDASPLAWARTEDDRRLSARVWAAGDLPIRKVASVEARVARALARRRDLLVDAAATGTNAFRLIHGEGDDLPGLFVDRLGPLLRMLVVGRASDPIRERVIDALHAQWPVTPEGEAWSVLELLHLRSEGDSEFDRVRWIVGGEDALRATGLRLDGAGFEVLERGLRFHVDPGWDSPRQVRPGFGLFLDQRENRKRLEPLAARGGTWLNLFCHTGAFSVSLLDAGAARVCSVDLSAAYLSRLEANLQANVDRPTWGKGIDPARHESIRSDCRRYLESLAPDERFAGIVLDPPTAAAAGRRFWSLRRDLEPLLARCLAHLAPGGVLLVTQNRAGPPLA